MIFFLISSILVLYIIPESRKFIDINYVISVITILITSIVVFVKYNEEHDV